jgi:hypothetical protein
MRILASDTPDTSNVINFSYAFKDAPLVESGVADWDVTNGFDFRSMFENASSFNESLENWDVSEMSLANGIFAGSGMTTESYDATLIGWQTTAAQTNVNMSPVELSHCQANAVVAYLEDTLSWIIEDEGQDTSLCGPSDIELSVDDPSIDENSAGEVIGVLSAVDVDTTQTYTYRLDCSQTGDSTFFRINGDELVLNTELDYENPQDDNGDNIYEVCVSVEDGNGFTTTQTFSIRVNNIDDQSDESENGGAVLGVTTGDETDQSADSGQVLSATDESEGAVLAETGRNIISGLLVGLVTVVSTLMITRASVPVRFKLRR